MEFEKHRERVNFLAPARSRAPDPNFLIAALSGPIDHRVKTVVQNVFKVIELTKKERVVSGNQRQERLTFLIEILNQMLHVFIEIGDAKAHHPALHSTFDHRGLSGTQLDPG